MCLLLFLFIKCLILSFLRLKNFSLNIFKIKVLKMLFGLNFLWFKNGSNYILWTTILKIVLFKDFKKTLVLTMCCFK